MIIGGIIFVLGLIFGSFLNAYEYRLETNKKLKGRSFCPHCKTKIDWHDNIPLISFIILAGKCRHCKKRISFQYPIIELLTGIAFILAGYQTSFISTAKNYLINCGNFPSREFFLFLLLATIYFYLILIAVYDAKTKYVLSAHTYITTIIAGLYSLANYTGAFTINDITNYFYPFLLAAIIPALLFWSLSKISKEKAMGAGDAEIALIIGFLLGPTLTIVSYYFAFIIGAGFGLIAIFAKKAKLKSEIPLGPFLIGGVFFATLLGEQIISWYAKIFLGI